jgi:glycosyltransferase involved in cell wall biosynthesis
MNPEGRVDVVIPTFNRREVLVSAVRSVLGQTYGDLHCVVVDNGSTDGTAEALAALGDDRLSVIRRGQRLGPSGARNLGIASSSGAPWLAFLDSDDLWAPDKLERQVGLMKEHPEALWSATGCVTVSGDLQIRSAVRLLDGPAPGTAAVAAPDTVVAPQELLALLKEENHVPAGSSTVLVARQLVDRVGGFCTELSTNEDWDLWLRFAAASAMAYVDLPLVACRVWPDQTSRNGAPFVASAATVRTRNFPHDGPLPRDYAARWDREAARRHVASGRRWPAALSYAQAAWTGRNPGQLAYAVLAAGAPGRAERRLRRVEATRAPEGWGGRAEGWLAAWRAG